MLANVDKGIGFIVNEITSQFPLTFHDILQATKTDATLQIAIKSIESNIWPTNISNHDPLSQLYNRRTSLTTYNMLLFLDRITVPKKLQHQVLQELHQGHPGITRMKRIPRSYVYWPDNDITALVQNCHLCLKT